MPFGLTMVAMWSGVPARTSDLVAQVRDVCAKNKDTYWKPMDRLGVAACTCAKAVDSGAVPFIQSLREFADALVELADATRAPIVPEPWRELDALAKERRSVFMPSGAGGGDFGLWFGVLGPTDEWLGRAESFGFKPVRLQEDPRGVRVLD
jgi:mevalonate kinase